MKYTITKKKPQEILPQVDPMSEIRRRSFDRMNIRGPARPMVDGKPLDPVLPPDLTVLTDVALGKLFSEFCCMAQYVQLHLAVRGVELAIARRNDKLTRAKVRLEKIGINLDKEAKTEMDERSQVTGFDLLLGEGAFSLTEAVMQGYIVGKDAISRELTRRISMTRNDRIT